MKDMEWGNREDAEWSSQQKEVASFSTVEDFWRVYNNILPVRELEANCNYHYFKVSEVWLFWV